MKKKILSAVTAGVVAVGLIGCGGGDSESSQGNTIKGIDGYVMNAKVIAEYWDSKENKIKEYHLTNKDNYHAIVGRDKKKGSPEYSLKELNSTILDNLVSIVLQQQNRISSDGTFYPKSFFDANANGVFDNGIDEFIPEGLELKAPKGFSVVTPVSTIIAAKVETLLNNSKSESNLSEVIDTYTQKMADALGVSKDTITKVDPLTLKDSKDEKAKAFVVVNAMLGAVVAKQGDDELAKVFDKLEVSSPKKAEDVLENAAKIAEEAGDNKIAKVFRQIKGLVKSDKTNLDNLLKANLDKTREESKKGNLNIVALDAKIKDYNATIVSNFIATKNGYKIKPDDLDNITIKLTANDKNISTKTIYFVARLWNPRDRMEQDNNVSEIAIKVPVEINATDGAVKDRKSVV